MSTLLRLYLVRHAQAEANHPLGDAARRLTAEGRAAFRARAEALAREAQPVRILTSPYVRARETAELLGAATGAAVEAEEALASGRSTAQELVRIARVRGDGTVLVGHNPEVANAVALVAGREVPVPPGTIACLEFAEDDAGWPRLAWLR
jgi:phosphohistidine phosphatase